MDINKLSKIVLFLSASLLATSSLASVNYAGTDCKHEFGGEIDADWTGATTNVSAGTSYVVCHVPHADFDGFAHNGAIESGFFTAVDEGDGQNVSCRFRSIWQSGVTLNANWAGMGSTAGHGNHIQKIGLLGTNLENSDSVYVLSCTLPGQDPASGHRSLIRGYRVDQ